MAEAGLTFYVYTVSTLVPLELDPRLRDVTSIPHFADHLLGQQLLSRCLVWFMRLY